MGLWMGCGGEALWVGSSCGGMLLGSNEVWLGHHALVEFAQLLDRWDSFLVWRCSFNHDGNYVCTRRSMDPSRERADYLLVGRWSLLPGWFDLPEPVFRVRSAGG